MRWMDEPHEMQNSGWTLTVFTPEISAQFVFGMKIPVRVFQENTKKSSI